MEALLEVAVASSFSSKLASVGSCRPWMHDRLLLSSYVLAQEWVHHLVDIVALGLEGAREIIDRSSPFNRGSLWLRTCATSTPLFSWCR